MPGIAGLGLAAEASRIKDQAQRGKRRESGGYPRDGLASIEGVLFNRPAEDCLPETVNVSFQGLRGDTIVDVMSARGVAVSTGPACHSNQSGLSRVLLAMGFSPERACGAVRFSCSRYTTRAEIDEVVEITEQTVQLLHTAAHGTRQ